MSISHRGLPLFLLLLSLGVGTAKADVTPTTTSNGALPHPPQPAAGSNSPQSPLQNTPRSVAPLGQLLLSERPTAPGFQPPFDTLQGANVQGSKTGLLPTQNGAPLPLPPFFTHNRGGQGALEKLMLKIFLANQALQASVADQQSSAFDNADRPVPGRPFPGLQSSLGMFGSLGASNRYLPPGESPLPGNQGPSQIGAHRDDLPTDIQNRNNPVQSSLQLTNTSLKQNADHATWKEDGRGSPTSGRRAQEKDARIKASSDGGLSLQVPPKPEDPQQPLLSESPLLSLSEKEDLAASENLRYVMISACLGVIGIGVLVMVVVTVVSKRRRRRYDRCRGISDDCELRSNFQLVNEDEHLGIRRSSTYFM